MIWLQAEKDRVSLAEGYIYYFVVIVLALSLSSSHVLFERYYWFLRSQSFFSQRWLAIFIDRDWEELNVSATEILSSSSSYEVIIQVVKLSGHIYSPSLVPSKSRLPRKCWYSVCMSSLCDVVAVKTVVLANFAIRCLTGVKWAVITNILKKHIKYEAHQQKGGLRKFTLCRILIGNADTTRQSEMRGEQIARQK